MTVYLPRPYPDELLMSVVARYCAHVGGPVGDEARRRWFGQSLTTPLALPEDAERFVASTNLGMGGEDLLNRHTLLPYFEAYDPHYEGARGRVVALVRRNANHFRRAPRKRYLLAWPAFLRFCPACVADDLRIHGETYWRRYQQLPGVLYCADHGRPLWRSALTSSMRLNGRPAVDASQAVRIGAEPDCDAFPSTAAALAIEIAKRTRALMDGPFGRWRANPRRSDYRDALIRTASGGGTKDRLGEETLVRLFETTFGTALIERSGVMGTARNRWYWLGRLVTDETTSWPPLRHVMFQVMLDEVRKVRPSAPPDAAEPSPWEDFGAGPWHCPNPLGRHSGPTISAVRISKEAKVPTAYAACPCGLEFTFRPGPDPQRPVPRKVYQAPPDWPGLARRWFDDGVSKREIAERLNVRGCSVPTILKPDGSRCPSVRDRLHARRADWEQLCGGPGGYAAAMEANGNLYRWLLSHDREWLNSTRAEDAPRRAVRPKRGRDWTARDRELVSTLRAKAAIIVADPSGPRRSISLLLQAAGLAGSLVKHKETRDKLPETVAFLNGWREPRDDYHERKLRSAARDLRIAGHQVREARLRLVTHLTSLRQASGPRFRALFHELITDPR